MNIFITIIITVLIFGLIIFIHELGHFILAKASKIKVNEFSMGMGPVIWKRMRNETQYSIRLFPIGGFVQMEGEDDESDDEHAFSKVAVWKRMLVVLAGAIMNFLLGILLVGIITGAQSKVVSLNVGSLTQESDGIVYSQFQEGDRITKINGHRPLTASDFQFQLSRIRSEDSIDITVERDGKSVLIENASYQTNRDGSEVRTLGINLQVEDLTVQNFFSNAIGNSVFYAKLVWSSIMDLVQGRVGFQDLSGPVGVGQAVSEAQSYGVLSVLSLFAFITINVGVLNLMPFPALDGGKFIFLLIELIFRKPVKKEIEGYINFIGFALLIILMVLITAKDIFNLF